MKTSSLVALCLALTIAGTQAQTANNSGGQSGPTAAIPKPTPFRIVDIGANHRTWQRETYERGPQGEIVTHVHQFKELATGMYYQENGQWQESEELIEPYSAGAIARRGNYQVIFANNLNSAGAIDAQLPSGQRLTSNILGLGYYDSSTGQAVLIAQVKDSYGQLLSANQVIYPDAFDNVSASVRYTYKRSGMAQDVVLESQLPAPESFGMNPAATKLEILTEFINSPDATVTVETDNAGTAVDENISWGTTRIGHGRAFDLSDGVNPAKVAVQKKYVLLQGGRKILIEMVPIKPVNASLSKLPLQSSIKTNPPKLASSQEGIIPVPRKLAVKSSPMKLAAMVPPAKGYLLDYATVDTDLSDVTFHGDTTYLISGDVNLSGVTTLNTGTVIKFDTNSDCTINVLGPLVCRTGPYRPAVLTSINDNTIGESIGSGGSSGAACTGTIALHVQNDWSEDLEMVYVYDVNWNTLVDDEGWPAITSGNSADYSFDTGLGQPCYFDSYDANGTEFFGQFNPTLVNGTVELDEWGHINYSESGDALCNPPPPPPPPVVAAISLPNGGAAHDLRIMNIATGISSDGNCSVTNIQFMNCGTALQIENGVFYAGNILMSGVGTGFYGQNSSGRAEQLTFDQGTHVTDDPLGTEAGTSVTLVNALLTEIGDYGVIPVTTDHVANLQDNTGIYQVVGAGSYYLAANSSYHNAGTANISSSLLDDLAQRTTYPPIVYSNTNLANATTFDPQAQRDDYGNPDYGYHYDPLDYAFGNVTAASNVTFSAGTAVAWFFTWSGGAYALAMGDSATAMFNGTVTAPCYWVKYNRVQESQNGNWTSSSYQGAITSQSYTHAAPSASCQFTTFSSSAGEAGPFGVNSGNLLVFNANHCEFYVGGGGGYYCSMNVTNCLFVDAGMGLWENYGLANITLQGCTFYGGTVLANGGGGSGWPVQILNCAFDSTTFSMSPNGAPTNGCYTDYNSFLSGSNRTLYPGGHDVIVTGSYNWQSSWLGNFYLPPNSPLIDKGNTNANFLGLYHFTTQTNQVKEANSIVDIGYHFVAVDAYGNPIDTDGDGVPDYLEDSNGDGIYDAGDLSDWLVSPYNGLSRTHGLSVFTPLK